MHPGRPPSPDPRLRLSNGFVTPADGVEEYEPGQGNGGNDGICCVSGRHQTCLTVHSSQQVKRFI